MEHHNFERWHRRCSSTPRSTGLSVGLLRHRPLPAERRATLRAAMAASLARPHAWWVEIAVVLGFYAAYESTRALAPATRAGATINADRLIAFEHAAHLDPELAINRALAPLPWLSALAGYYYLTLHFAVTVGVLIFLYLRRPSLYAWARSSIVLASYSALLVYWLVPVAPPRLAQPGVIDVVVEHNIFGAAAAQQGDSGFENVYAAMPSLHVGWAVWAAVVTSRTWVGPWHHLGWLYPVATALVVLSTGNHYLADALAGAAVVLAADHVSARLLRGNGDYPSVAADRPPRASRPMTE
jgi:hypothetical protein